MMTDRHKEMMAKIDAETEAMGYKRMEAAQLTRATEMALTSHDLHKHVSRVN
jgi:hypothetical protein